MVLKLAVLIGAMSLTSVFVLPSVVPAVSTVAPGATLSFAVTNVDPPGAMDWVALTPATGADNSYVDWWYLNGSKTAPTSGVVSAALTFVAPTTPGAYNIRLYANNSLAVKLATSDTITVSGLPLPPQQPSGAIVFSGDSITAPSNIQGAQNWTSIVAAHLGLSFVNLAGNDKYASDVLAQVPQMNGQVCMVMIGTNDMVGSVMSSVHADVSRTGYLSTMRQIVIALKPRCGRVVILSPPLSLSALEAVRYPAWIDGLRLLCAEQDVTFLDLFHHMADLAAITPYATVNGWYSDWRHLTAAGHAVIGAFVSRSLTVSP